MPPTIAAIGRHEHARRPIRVGEDAAEPSRESRGADPVAGAPSRRSLGRCGRRRAGTPEQVEHEQQDVDDAGSRTAARAGCAEALGVAAPSPEVAGAARRRSRSAQQRRRSGRDDRARRCDPELDARATAARAPSWRCRRTATGRCPLMPIPLRIATSACPSSCRRSTQKKQQRADRGERERLAVVPRECALVLVRQGPDDEEQDDEPARIHADADPEDPGQLNRAAA